MPGDIAATAPAAPTPAKSWRDVLPVHPAAELFPPLEWDELLILGSDIKKNGLNVPVSIYCDDDGKYWVLDGRNRLDAMEAVGVDFKLETNIDAPWKYSLRVNDGFYQVGCVPVVNVNPYAYVISANIHRRHLTPEKKHELIELVIKAQPEKSDRQIAKETKTDHKVVGRVRKRLEGRGAVPHVETRTDTKGRKQPARKKPAKPKLAPSGAKVATGKIIPQSADDVEQSAAARKAEAEAEDERDPNSAQELFGGDPETKAEKKKLFLMITSYAETGAEKLFSISIKPDADILERVRDATREWIKLAEKMGAIVEPAPAAKASKSTKQAKNPIEQANLFTRELAIFWDSFAGRCREWLATSPDLSSEHKEDLIQNLWAFHDVLGKLAQEVDAQDISVPDDPVQRSADARKAANAADHDDQN